MYNSGDNRLGPAGHGFTGYDIVGEFLKAIMPKEDAGEQSHVKSAKLSTVRSFIHGLRRNRPPVPARQTPAETGRIYTKPTAQHN